MTNKKFSNAIIYSVFVLLVSFFPGCDNEESPSQNLPSGCQSPQGNFAIAVLQSDIACGPTNAYADTSQALGQPNAFASGPGKLEIHGFLSLGINGSVTLFMGSCIQDLPGPDLRVYQTISREAVEVQVSQSVNGPFVSLGTKDCNDPPPFFHGFCEFDLSGSGLSNARIVKVIDRETLTFPGTECDSAGPSPGADIDAVGVVSPVLGTRQD